MQTPQMISAQLLTTLLLEVKALKLDDDNMPIDQGVLLLGLAEALGDLLGSIALVAQKELVPEILARVIAQVPGSSVLVATKIVEETKH